MDSRNVKWFGTLMLGPEGSGVYSFDGTEWKHYTAENSGLHSNTVTAIGADSQGNVWFSTYERGHSRFDGTQWFESDDPAFCADHIREGPDGRVWFGAEAHLHGYDGTDWMKLDYSNSPFGTSVSDFCFDGEGTLWVGTGEENLWSFDWDNWLVTNVASQGPAANNIEEVVVPPPGAPPSLQVWLSYTGNDSLKGTTVFDFSTGQWITYTEKNSSLPYSDVESIAIDYDGVVWFGTQKGVASFDGENWQVYKQGTSGLFRNSVTVVGVDRDNVKWFCHSYMTDISGKAIFAVSSFDGVNWAHYEKETPASLAMAEILCFAEGPNGAKWFGTIGDGLYCLALPAFYRFTPENSPLPWDTVSSIFFDSDGAMWIAGGQGPEPVRLIRYGDGGVKFFSPETTGIVNKNVHCMNQDPAGRLYFGTARGLSVYDGVGWLTFDNKNSPMTSRYVKSVSLDWLGNTWIGTAGGLSVLMAGPFDNEYPERPTLSTEWRSVLAGEMVQLSAESVDPNGDELQFRFDWAGSETTDWQQVGQAAKAFDVPGRYPVKAQARDSKNAVSGWSMPFDVVVQEAYGPAAFAWTNSDSYAAGQTLVATVYAENRGEAHALDVLIYFELPDGARLYYPNWGADVSAIPVTLQSGAKVGPFDVLQFELPDWLDPGNYVFRMEFKEQGGADVIDVATAQFKIR
nr:hypothetical protein [Bacillota bacterium]